MPSEKGICFVTHNTNKLVEITHLAPAGFDFYGLEDLGVEEEIPETGSTIRENAEIKASYVYKKFQIACFADDTGLEINALNGAPGVYSARYAGPLKDPAKNMDLVLTKMKGIQDRTAQFKTVISFIDEKGNTNSFEGVVQGKILNKPIGEGGFGYDPIFTPDGYEKTFAEMPLSEKNQISHRSIAFHKFFSFLTSADE